MGSIHVPRGSCYEGGLEDFVALPAQMPVLGSSASVILDVGQNRSGKSLIAGAKVVSLAFGLDGRYSHLKPPLKISILAVNYDHVGLSIYPILFEPGYFKLPDGTPGRAFIPKDLVVEKKFTPGGESLGKIMFARLCNGTKIWFRTSEQKRKAQQGFKSDVVWQDEELGIHGSELFVELSRSLVDSGGVYIYSCCPLAAERHLINLRERARWTWKDGIREDGPGQDEKIEEFILQIEDNRANLSGIEEFRANVLATDPYAYDTRCGKFKYLYYSKIIFDNFRPEIQVVKQHEPPPGATLYESIDPGFKDACSVGFYYVILDQRYCRYDEIYKVNMGYPELVAAIKEKRALHHYAEPTVCWLDRRDDKKSMACPEGTSATLAKLGLKNRRGLEHTKDPDGIRACWGDLAPDKETGKPRFTVTDNCVHFIEEIKSYERNRVGKITEKDCHAMDEWRNFRMSGCWYAGSLAYVTPQREGLTYTAPDGMVTKLERNGSFSFTMPVPEPEEEAVAYA